MKFVKLIVHSVEKLTHIDNSLPTELYWAWVEMPSARRIKIRLTKRDYELLQKPELKCSKNQRKQE